MTMARAGAILPVTNNAIGDQTMLKKLITAAVFSLSASMASAATIEIDTQHRVLMLMQDDGTTKTYRIAVGRPDEQWTGVKKITRKAEWPEWHPTAQERDEDPTLPSVVPGGPGNPLGARALYIGGTLYRIHGTTKPKSIGHAASGGCFRMLNRDVIDLYDRVPVGTTVIVR